MSEIKKLIERLCPDGVEYRKLVDLAEVGTGSSNKQDSTDDGKYPFFVRSKFVERHNDYEYDEEAIIIPGEGGIGDIFHYINGKYALHQRVYRIHFITNSVNAKFAYYYLRNSFKKYILGKAVSATVTSIRKPMIQNFEIPVPPIEVQSKIVEILDNFTELEAELEARRKQYEYYRNQLLTFDKVGGARFDVKWMKLIDVLEQPITDGPHETPKFYDVGVPFISVDAIVNNQIDFSKKRGFISEEYDNICRKKYAPKMHDIYLVKSGSTTGKVAIVKTEEKFNIWSPLAAIRVNKDNDPFYVFYVLQTKQVQDQIQQKCSKGSQPNLSMRVLEKFIIPVPPLSEQQRIVSILDRFEALTTDLQSGLPAEIEARRKQYEYYREQLLTFKRKTA